MPDQGASAPLLAAHSQHPQHPPPASDSAHDSRPRAAAAAARRHVARLRVTGRRLLDSRRKHYAVMALVGLDAAVLLANVFLRLIACEMRQDDEPWVQAVSGTLETVALVISCLFMLELAACLFAYGLRCAPPIFPPWLDPAASLTLRRAPPPARLKCLPVVLVPRL